MAGWSRRNVDKSLVLPSGEYLAVLTEYRRVHEGQTSCHGIVRAMHTRRAVKTYLRVIKLWHTSRIWPWSIIVSRNVYDRLLVILVQTATLNCKVKVK